MWPNPQETHLLNKPLMENLMENFLCSVKILIEMITLAYSLLFT